MTQVGSLRMCLDPDVVPPLAGFLLLAVLGVLHHIIIEAKAFMLSYDSAPRPPHPPSLPSVSWTGDTH
jgi:hypothetical protein